MQRTPHLFSTLVESVRFCKTAYSKILFSGLLMIGLMSYSTSSFSQLLQWNTSGNLGTETTEPSVANNVNIASSNLTQGSITAAANGNRFGGSGWFNTGNTVAGNTLAEAIAGNDYIQFVVTPNAGFSFTPTTFVFYWDRSSAGPSSVTLRSSSDGFTNDLGTVSGMVSGGAALTTLRTITISGLSNITTATTFRLYGYGATATGGTGGFDIGTNVVNVQLNGTTASTATPTLNVSGSLSALSTVYGTASSTTSFNVTGSDMSHSIVVGPLAGFEFADNSVGTYFSTLTLPNTVTVSKTIDVRVAATTPFGSYSGNIPVTSTNATSQSIAIPASSVSVKPISITGITANNKIFDGNSDATLSGTPSLVGVETADISNVILGGTAIATFASSAVANGILVSVSGYTISGSAAANYSLLQPTGLIANITPASLLPQVITFNALADITYGSSPITLTATGGGSGNPVTYISSNTNVATIAGNVLTIVGAGSTVITASQLGDGSTYADAVPVDQTQNVNVKPLTISGGSANNKVYDGTNAATVNAGTLIGVVGLDDVNLSGTSGTFASVNVANGISVTSAFTLTGADALNYSLTQSIYTADITIASQIIIFNALSSKSFGDANFQLTATGGNSGNIITYASDNNAVAIITGDMVEIVGAGTANITASQAGNSNYTQAVDVIQQLQVNQATQTIVFAALPNKTTDDISFTLTASGGNSGNPITFQSSDPLVASIAGNVVTINAVGTTTITASQAGNANYSDAIDITRTLTVTCPLVAGWDMNPLTGGSNNFGVSPYSATTSHSNATIGGLTRGAGVNASGTAAARAWGGLGWNNPTALDNINANKFITFTAKSNTGFIMNLCSVNPFNYRRSSTGPTNGLLQYSLDGINFVDITTLNFPSSSASGASAGNVDLSSITSLQNIGSSKTITFRLIPYGASNASGTFYLFDIANTLENDFALTGEIAPCTPTSNTTVVSSCDMYLWSENGQTYTVSGTYSNTADCHTESIDLTITTSLVCQNGGINNVNCGCDCLPGFIGTNCEIAVCFPNAGSSTQTVCDSLVWNATTYFTSGTYTGTFVNVGGCDSVHTLNLTINSSNTGSSSQTSCNSFTWNGTTYTASGTPTHTYTNVAGCDSVHTLNLTINSSNTGSSSQTSCNSYTWNGTTYTASGTPTHTYTNVVGCDSVHTLNLTINLSNTGSSSQTSCNSFTWNGTTYTASGTPTHTYTNVAGCDSVHLLNLTINNSNTGSSSQTSCNSFTWNGTTYTASGTPTHTYTNVVGCDSVHTLNLTINLSNTGSSSQTSCNSFTWNGTTYTASGTPTHTYTNVAGCDSVHLLNLTINSSNTGSSSQTSCNSFTWNGTTYTASGTPTHIYTNVSGCDSVHTLNLTINSSNTGSSSQTSCNSYTWNGTTYTASGTPTHTYTNVSGCDSVHTLNLTINSSNTGSSSQTSCNSFTWNGTTYTASGTPTHTYTNVAGCDSVHTLNLTINSSNAGSSSQTSCNSFTWNGTTYTASGTPTHTYTNISGCDSVHTLNLTINSSNTGASSQTSCNSFTWNGTTYTASGTPTHTYTNVAGCDSVHTLNLTINSSTSNSVTEVACDSYTWNYNNTTYTATGIYTVTSLNMSGCTHSEILDLTITQNTSTTTTITECGGYTWSVNSVNYTNSGIYTHAVGCQTYILDLTIITTFTYNDTISNLSCYTWPVNGVTYTASGLYTFTTTNANTGCAETFNLNLTVVQGLKLATKAILSGPYVATGIGAGLMHDSLRVLNQIPSNEPYSSAPFNKPQIAGLGGETVSPSILSVTGTNAIVDWVFVELRNASTPSIIVATKRALIQRDGDVVSNIDGVSPVFFAGMPVGNYFVSIKHRNHLGIMTASSMYMDDCLTSSFDFTTGAVYSIGVNPPRKLIGAVNALWSADCNNNKNVKYNGLANDKDFILAALGGVANASLNNVYRVEDANMDGKIRYNNTDNDRMIIINNIGVSTPNNIIHQHTPN